MGKLARHGSRASRRAVTLVPRLITLPIGLLLLLAQPHKLLRWLLRLVAVFLVLLLFLAPIWLMADDEDDETSAAAVLLMTCGGLGVDGGTDPTSAFGPTPPFADSSTTPAVFPTPGGGLPSPATLQEVAELADPAELARLANLTSLSDLIGIPSNGPTARAAIGYTDRQPATIGTMNVERVLAALRTIESGTPQGNYRAFNAHGGAGGAYQFLPGTWRGVGGTGSARDAPPAEQDMRARRYLAELNAANPGPLSLSAGLSWFLGPGGVKPFMVLPWDHAAWDPARDGEGTPARLYRARFSLAYLALSLQGGEVPSTSGVVAASAPGGADIAAAETELVDLFAAQLFAAGIDPEEIDPDEIDCAQGGLVGEADQASHVGRGSSSGGAVSADGYSLPVDRHYYDSHPDWFTKHHHGPNPAADIPVGGAIDRWRPVPVYAMVDGEVIRRNPGGYCGWGVVYRGDDGGEYIYCHASMVPDHIQPGRRVRAGEQIMMSGGCPMGHTDCGGRDPPESVGRSTGPHLHVGLRVNGDLSCPQQLFVAIANGDPINIGDLPSNNCNSYDDVFA